LIVRTMADCCNLSADAARFAIALSLLSRLAVSR
jgi:hypothetical protein